MFMIARHKLMPTALWLLLMVSALFTSLGSTVSAGSGMSRCQGHFVNPITDICWECLFPLSIGSAEVVPGDKPDTPNPGVPVCACPVGNTYRVGINFGYWEPFALTDVTRTPFCMVNMGGITLKMGKLQQTVGSRIETTSSHEEPAFYWVHWYKYPLIYWLNLLTSVGCLQHGDMDLAYMSEIDPTWDDDELSFILNPEAILFGNAITQTACIADSIMTTTGHTLPIDALFWCLGNQGGAYPLDGSVAAEASPIQAATQLTERMDFKLHREGLVWDSSPAYTCFTHPSPILPKSRYRYQMVNTVPATHACYPFGTNTEIWEAGHEPPSNAENFGFLIWRKRNCCYE